VLYLAHTFGVSFPAMTYRLQNLHLIAPAFAERLRADRATSPKRRARDASIAHPFPDSRRWELLPERYVFLAFRAYRNELISTGRLAEYLRTDQDAAASRYDRYFARAENAAAGPDSDADA
jgi:hypothetical protein